MKIIAVEPIGINSEKCAQIQAKCAQNGYEFVLFPDRNEDEEVLAERLKDADIGIVSNIKLGRNILERCPKLKMLSVAFTGLDHIDLEYCRTRGIVVRNASGYATTAVAELTIGLMLDLSRRITALDAATRNGGTRANFLGSELSGKTVSVVGTGAIGCRVAALLHAFGCDVIAYSRSENPKIAAMGIPYVTLSELMRRSDIITLHTPLTAETFHLIGAAELALCKATALLINTARGNVVDLNALAAALTARRLAGAGFDVFDIEPPLPTDHPLLHAPNCVVVPHIGYATKEAFDARIDIVIENIWRS